MFNIDDDFYTPPTKEFIRNSLTYGLLSDEQELEDVNTDLAYLTTDRGRLVSELIEFAIKNKDRIIRIPLLGRLALSIKRSMMSKSFSAQRVHVSELDFTDILGLGIDDFIRQLYLLALGRLPDAQGIEHWKFTLNNGAKREAIIYIVCTSKEFAARRQVAHLSEYRKAYRIHRIREGIKRTPLLGWLWSFVAIPRRFTRLAEALLLQSNVLQTRIDTFSSENSRSFQNLSTQMKMLSSQQNALQAQLDIANQNIIKAHVKLDEIGVAILNAVNRTKPVIYGLPGGVTAIQAKDYIIGVPSEEWRLALFLSQYGRFEFGTEDFFRSILKEGMNVLDIGANLGIYTLHALAAGCYVYSYEPTPKVFNILVDNIGINGFEPTGRAHTYNLAVSDTEGEMKFAVYENLNGHNTFFPSDENDKTIPVKTVNLDNHLAHLSHVDVAKIDVEGAEHLVLKGMKEIIARNPHLKIIMEFAPSHLNRAGKDPLEFIQQICSMGLGIRLIDENSGKILEISDEDLCKVYSVNLLLEKSS
jgi:FkbM family methyltransferase